MTSGTSSQGTLSAVAAPAKVDMAMPRAAAVTALTRVLDTPRNDTKPAGSAPRAAYVPSAACPAATPMASGAMTPSAARTARPGAASCQLNWPKSSHPPWRIPPAA